VEVGHALEGPHARSQHGGTIKRMFLSKMAGGAGAMVEQFP